MKKYLKRAATNTKTKMCFKEEPEDTFKSSKEHTTIIRIIQYIDDLVIQIFNEVESEEEPEERSLTD